MSEKMKAEDLHLYYGEKEALKGINISIDEKKIVSLIGPSGCGKSTFLRCLNRMNDLIKDCRIEGKIYYNNEDIYAPGCDTAQLRKNVGMVFQKPNPFPFSIFENIAYGPKTHGLKNKVKLQEKVEKALTEAGLWDEVKDRLNSSAMGLSGGQMQRLCIARALAPISTEKIEELLLTLKDRYTIVIVTHNMQQALRISDMTAFFLLGEMVEYGETTKMFYTPHDKRTEDYITGRFG